jgi:hypothetical protein
MALNEIEIKALNEIKSSLEFSINSINEILIFNEKRDMRSEIKDLIRDWSTIRHDQYGILTNGDQSQDTIESLKILENYLMQSEKMDNSEI